MMKGHSRSLCIKICIRKIIGIKHVFHALTLPRPEEAV